MKPTQAQIEAAKMRLSQGSGTWADCRTMRFRTFGNGATWVDFGDPMTDPREALTAIRDWTLTQPDTIWFDQITTLHDYCDNVLAAAAEVGGQRQEGMAWIAHEAKLRTIERCAQVAEQFAGPLHHLPNEIAAAIRAQLKDQP